MNLASTLLNLTSFPLKAYPYANRGSGMGWNVVFFAQYYDEIPEDEE